MHRTDVVSPLQFPESFFFCDTSLVYMDLLSWFWLVVFFSWWFGVSSTSVIGRKFLSDLHGASPVLLETGFWDIVLYVWATCAIIAILAISMARSKNTGKGKAPSSSVERAVKKENLTPHSQ